MSTPYSSFIPQAGHFPYDLFVQVARDCKDDDIIVEVGAFLGHGTCFMCEALAVYDKRPKFYAFDPWDQVLERVYGKMRDGDMPWGEPIEDWKKRVGGPTPLYDAFLFYLNGCPANGRLWDHAQFPANCSGPEFEENSLAFVFLNYSREDAEIDKEVANWFPHVRPGGILAIWNPEWEKQGGPSLRTMLKA
ncbi:MAG: class I SAM-dependent methyltransferase [Candidatus Paceibacterota bacterium]